MRKPTFMLALFALAFAACAQGSAGGSIDGAVTGDDTPDAEEQHVDAADPDAMEINPIDASDIDAIPIDAMPIDGPPAPVPVTLNQNTNQTLITLLNSVTCNQTGTGYTTDNQFYRVFTLANEGVPGQFTATHFDFGLEEIDAGGAATTLNVDIRLHTLTGAFTTGNLTLRHSQVVTLNETLDNTIQAITLSSPVVFAPGSTVVAELHVADGVAASNIFFPGSNTAGETQPSYVRAAGASACNINEPVTYASLGFPSVHMLIKLRGTTP
jgi:hypothetical protein